jgi:hypothetical protein
MYLDFFVQHVDVSRNHRGMFMANSHYFQKARKQMYYLISAMLYRAWL